MKSRTKDSNNVYSQAPENASAHEGKTFPHSQRQQLAQSIRLIRRQEVEYKTALSKSAIYAKLKPNPKRPSDYDPTFPRAVTLGRGGRNAAVAWNESEVDQWIHAQIEQSRTRQRVTSQCEADSGSVTPAAERPLIFGPTTDNEGSGQ